MNDSIVTLQELKNKMATFVSERKWEQFHSPKNLSMSIAIEAAELMEKFQWIDQDESKKEMIENRQEIEDEVSDILAYILSLADQYEIDLSTAFYKKIAIIEGKYPVKEVAHASVKKLVFLHNKWKHKTI